MRAETTPMVVADALDQKGLGHAVNLLIFESIGVFATMASLLSRPFAPLPQPSSVHFSGE